MTDAAAQPSTPMPEQKSTPATAPAQPVTADNDKTDNKDHILNKAAHKNP